MDAAQFRLPVRLQKADGKCIDEIYSAEEALDLLLAWPDQRGRAYDKAVKACFAATVDVESADQAQKEFAAFARLSGILANDMLPVNARSRRTGFRQRNIQAATPSLA
ncbi:DUF982 domain-containing protein [Mesorhizobium sp. CAU 1741]|uniref:DUF982 domain-containing protein n=1 Tax=Mesorhizobium sp. CAU 1741 TaxID=3140366 RepID=UPI00325A527A